MIAIDSTNIAARGQPLSEIWWRGSQWAVTTHGIERLDGFYVIERDRLLDFPPTGDYSWIKHMSGKINVELADFATAYFVACAMHGVQLSQDQVEMLKTHFADGEARQDRARKLRPYREKAKAKLGMESLGLTPAQFSAIHNVAVELAKADGVI